jgi:N-methylhydantoinase B/oxoprolinase/acetone carboxylase alpha subunit
VTGDVRPELLAHGTTVATNALLEGKGAPVALVTNAGLADLIEIARQDRPSLYDARVTRPDPLVDRAWRLEVEGRLAADGTELAPVPDAAVPEVPAGAEAVAVCLLHADLDPRHEQAVAEVIRARGLDTCCSHEVSPEVREYERTVTTVVNASLRPRLRAYLRGIGDVADDVLVMTSAGGLLPVPDAAELPAALLLSGPAGGVRAGAAAAVANGFGGAITFDMGGTSTDVCLIEDGAPAPAAERHVGGYTVRFPSLDIHTIGAGGGSLASIDPGGALVVGPESAGADPGPACYGWGGTRPTVTDADLVAGRIPADAAFGGIHLDLEAARAALVGAEVSAEGVIRVVDAAMERALRTVSVARGVDPRGLALVAFGGAGPLHACALAEALEMAAVIVPARAGVLSAVGLLTSPRQRDLVRSWPTPRDHGGIGGALEALAAEAGAGGARCRGPHRARLPVRRPEPRAHGGRRGRLPRRAPGPQRLRPPGRAGGGGGAAGDGPTTVAGRRWRSPGARTRWRAGTGGDRRDRLHHLGARRLAGRARRGRRPDPAAGPTVSGLDPAGLQVLVSRLAGIADEMGAVLRRSAYSPNIKERADCSAAVFTADGELLAQAEHIPVHLGSMPASVRAALEAYGDRAAAGDHIVLNDPFAGGTHLNDITVVSPCFAADRLVAWVANRAHHADVGGAAPGSIPADATDIAQEGLGSRPPGSARSCGAWCWRTAGPPTSAPGTSTRRSGPTRWVWRASPRWRLHPSTRWWPTASGRMRAELAELPDGTWAFEDVLDSTGSAEELQRPATIRVAVTVAADRITFDFTGTDPQSAGNVNAVEAVTVSAVAYALRVAVDPAIPANAGSLRPVRVNAPPGTLVAAQPPAAVGAGNVEVSQRIADVCLGALAQALPSRVGAAGQGTMNNLLIGGDGWVYYETVGGGEGAQPHRPGQSGIHTAMTNTKNTPIEALERAFPMRVLRYRLREGSGGAGRFRGGEGIERDLLFLEDVTVSLITERRVSQPWGLQGGGPGAGGENWVLPGGYERLAKRLPDKCTIRLKAGDVLRMLTPGGGGWGPA